MKAPADPATLTVKTLLQAMRRDPHSLRSNSLILAAIHQRALRCATPTKLVCGVRIPHLDASTSAYRFRIAGPSPFSTESSGSTFYPDQSRYPGADHVSSLPHPPTFPITGDWPTTAELADAYGAYSHAPLQIHHGGNEVPYPGSSSESSYGESKSL